MIPETDRTTRLVRSNRAAFAFALLVCVLMFASSVALVAVYGSNVPIWDDWDIIPTATGHQPVTLNWLWSQHNEHRVPIPRLILLALLRIKPMDFRAGMLFNLLVTAILSVGLVLTTRLLRGRSSFSDAFYPIVLMNWGQAVNLLWCWEVQFYASMFFATIFLIAVARSSISLKLPTVIVIGSTVMLLPLCGANGLCFVPALVLWMAYAAVVNWRSATTAGRRNAVVLTLFALVATFLLAFYFVGYDRVPYHPSTHNSRIIVRTALQVLTMSFGPGIVGLSTSHSSPIFLWRFICAIVVGLFLLAGLVLLMRWVRVPAERLRTAGLFLFLAAIASLAIALGMGRDGFETRYLTLSVPGLCAVYLVFAICGDTRVCRLATLALWVMAIAALVPNTLWGWRYARHLKAHLASFERDVRAGVPPYQLICNYSDLHPHHEIMADYLSMLRSGKVGNFRFLRDNPPFREVDVSLEPIDTNNITLKDGTARSTGPYAWVTFALPEEVQASGIRLNYIYSNAKGTEPYLGIYWKSRGESDFGEESYTKYSPTGDRANWKQGTWSRRANSDTIFDVNVCHPVQVIRIKPAIEQGSLQIHKLTVLVPSTSSTQ